MYHLSGSFSAQSQPSSTVSLNAIHKLFHVLFSNTQMASKTSAIPQQLTKQGYVKM